MAVEASMHVGNYESLKKVIAEANEIGLLSQDIANQAALHAISHLLNIGLTEANAVQMLTIIKKQIEILNDEYMRRGMKPAFKTNQTNFH